MLHYSSFLFYLLQFTACKPLSHVLRLTHCTKNSANIRLLSLSQVWSLPILLPPSPCRVPSWGSSSFSLGLAPLWALVCWLLCPSRRLAGCHPTETLVRDEKAYTLYLTTENLTCFLISQSESNSFSLFSDIFFFSSFCF